MKHVARSDIKDDLSKYLRLAENEEIIITRHGKPAGVLVGFASEEHWFDYKLENDPRFLQRIARAREPAGRQGSQARGTANRAESGASPHKALILTGAGRRGSWKVAISLAAAAAWLSVPTQWTPHHDQRTTQSD
jgi:prevent-host-death family protein